MQREDLIDALNELVRTCEDGARGFRVCADDADDLQLRTFFANRARAYAAAAEELQDLVCSYGGEAVTEGGWGGALHRRWIDVRALVSGRGDQAVLEECERGESVALLAYRHVLDSDLPPDVREVVERQYQGVLFNHDAVHGLRAQYRAL